MEQHLPEPRLWLETEYLKRRQKNPSYSLRAFANLLDLPSGRVSQLLSKKRRFTPKLGKKIALRLNYDPQKTHELLECIAGERKKKTSQPNPVSEGTYQPLEMDVFQSIADPIHFALLSLVETRDFQSDKKFIATRLRVSPVEARSAIDRLMRVGLLVERNGKLQLGRKAWLTTSHDLPSAAIRESHKKALEHAKECIDQVEVELRDITSMTMAIDPSKLPEAKARLREFRRSLSEFLESGRKEEVYRLNIQLVPISKRRRKQ